MLTELHHVQLAMPLGQERVARMFYSTLLGLREETKPRSLAGRGGVWLVSKNLRLHLGVDPDFQPATKAHPALICEDIDGLADRLTEADVPIDWDDKLPGHRRFYTQDPFGNRIEILAPN